MGLVAQSRKASRRFVQVLILCIVSILFAVVLLNNAIFQLIKSPDQIRTAEMIPGWGRIYKPLLYDAAQPEMVSFGYSWVRDLFDPEIAEPLIGQTFFNFGVSGGTSYESYRFMQGALAYHVPEAAFLDVRAFYDVPRARLTEHQFDDSILRVNRDGSPNTTVALSRWFKMSTAGAVLGSNIRFLRTNLALRAGSTRQDVLEPYQRRDWSIMPDKIADYRRKLTEPSAESFDGDIPTFSDLAASVKLLCGAGVTVHLYDGPYPCAEPTEIALSRFVLLKGLQAQCASDMTFHAFGYPNAVTMEGLQESVGESIFFRPDGHPRPTIGQLILTRILGLEGRDLAPTLPLDFGVDLLAIPESEARTWIAEKEGRCRGKWSGQTMEQILAELATNYASWADIAPE